MLLDIPLHFIQFKLALLSFVTAFVVAMLCMPFLIKIINRYHFYDVPDLRKMHSQPIPTMGGVAICMGMAIANLFWFRFSNDQFVVAFFLSIAILFALGILDDMHDISVRNKFVIQLAAASLIAFSGVRIESFNGLFGIGELPLTAQYTFTVIAIVGVTNAFNLIDGIDGLAGGLGFMSLLMVGLFLTIGQDANIALIAFSLAGSTLGFLYYNFNPARIFMGDTGSLVLGFITAVLSIKLLNVQLPSILPHAPVFVFGIVLIPVFDTLRVFALRIWAGKSPFSPDKIHIHHLLTANGWSHNFTSKMICAIHGFILVLSFFLKNVRQEYGIAILIFSMLLVVHFFKKLKFVHLAPQKTPVSSS